MTAARKTCAHGQSAKRSVGARASGRGEVGVFTARARNANVEET